MTEPKRPAGTSPSDRPGSVARGEKNVGSTSARATAPSGNTTVEAVMHPRLWRARDIGIVSIAVIASIAAAKIAAPLLIPVVLGLLGSYALKPVVGALERVRVPRPLGALLVMMSLLAAIATTAWWLADDVSNAVAELPSAARKLRSIVHQWQETGSGPISHVQEAATELGKTAAEVAGQKPAETPRAAPQPETAPSLPTHFAENAALVVGIVGQISIALLLAGLMLADGDGFRRKLVRMAGSTLTRRRITVAILDEIDTQVQRQLLIIVGVNLLIALTCWLAFMAAGLGRAALWAALVGALHFIPYAGTVISTVAIGAVALVQTGSAASAFGFAALTAGIAIVIGFLLMGWWQGRAVRMNPVATFVALLFFGWLWGLWGLVIGGPLMAIVKVCADRIETLKRFSELIGE